MTRHYPNLGSASDWSCRVGNLIQPISSTTQIWVVMRHQYGISVLVSQTSFGGETSGNVTNMAVVFSGYYLVSLALNFADNKKIIIIIKIKNFSTLLAFDSADYSSLSSTYFCSLVLILTFAQ